MEVYLPAGYPEQKLKQLEVTSSSGDIEADAGLSVLGSLSVTSSSGDIQVGNIICGEEMAASASSGEIKIDQAAAAKAAKLVTSSGDIKAAFSGLPAVLSVESTSGREA